MNNYFLKFIFLILIPINSHGEAITFKCNNNKITKITFYHNNQIIIDSKYKAFYKEGWGYSDEEVGYEVFSNNAYTYNFLYDNDGGTRDLSIKNKWGQEYQCYYPAGYANSKFKKTPKK